MTDTPPSLEQQMQPLLLTPGFAFVSGGLTSAGRVAVVNLQKAEILFAQSDKPNSSQLDALVRVALSSAQVSAFRRSSAALFASKEHFVNTQPTADWDVILYLKPSSTQMRTFQAFGPAVGAVKTLYEQVWALFPQGR